MSAEEVQPFFEVFNHSTDEKFYRVENVVTPERGKCTTVTPAHYGHTVEIVTTKNIGGFALINGKKYDIQPQSVFFIPPGAVHSFRYITGGDFITVCKIDLDAMAQYLNFKNILKEKKIRINNIPVFCKKFDEVYGAICRIREETENISNLLRAFLDMIDALTSAYSTQDAQPQDDILLKLLDWIDEHYAEEITLANVSKYCGYNKNYFCKRFKELTDETFIDFLNTVRISKACNLLSEGKSIQSACFDCGFNNISYFIKTFKKILNITPSAYKNSGAK